MVLTNLRAMSGEFGYEEGRTVMTCFDWRRRPSRRSDAFRCVVFSAWGQDMYKVHMTFLALQREVGQCRTQLMAGGEASPDCSD